MNAVVSPFATSRIRRSEVAIRSSPSCSSASAACAPTDRPAASQPSTCRPMSASSAPARTSMTPSIELRSAVIANGAPHVHFTWRRRHASSARHAAMGPPSPSLVNSAASAAASRSGTSPAALTSARIQSEVAVSTGSAEATTLNGGMSVPDRCPVVTTSEARDVVTHSSGMRIHSWYAAASASVTALSCTSSSESPISPSRLEQERAAVEVERGCARSGRVRHEAAVIEQGAVVGGQRRTGGAAAPRRP